MTTGFTLTRTMDAPPRLVFQAWTDPEHLQWFLNPGHPTDEPIDVDLRVGGGWKAMMIIDEETRYRTGGTYREITPVERLVFDWGVPGGWPDASTPDVPRVTVTLDDLGERTEMTLAVTLPDHLSAEQVSEWMSSGMREGWSETIDRLVSHFD